MTHFDRTHLTRTLLTVAGGWLAGAAVLGAGLYAYPPTSSLDERPGLARPESAAQNAEAPSVEPTTEPEAEAEAEAKVDQRAEPAVRIALDDGAPEIDHLAAAEDALLDGDPAEALAALRRHLHHASPSVDVLLRVGRLAREQGNAELSAAALAEARGLDPEEPEVALQLARTELVRGRVAEARTAALAAVRLAPREAVAYHLLGRAEMAASRWDPAEAALDRAIQLDAQNPHLYNQLGLLEVYRRRGAAAVEALEAAVELFGAEVPGYVLNNLGLALELVGRLEAARAVFGEALAEEPMYVKARVNLRRIEASLAARETARARVVADGSFSEPGPVEAPEAHEEVAASGTGAE